MAVHADTILPASTPVRVRKSVALGVNAQAALWFGASFALLVGAWYIYAHSGFASKLLPAPEAVLLNLIEALRDPFYVHGDNDKGIGLHLLASLSRVALGFALAALIAIPLGIAIGLSPVAARAFDPYVQVLRPVSPLAWLPIGLALLKSSAATALFVITISSLWPILLNTIFGVRGINPTYLNVARTLGASRFALLRRVILPAAAPSIVAGLRIGIGIAWLVIIAAEMLIGGTGIGYFVWNEWNNLSIASIITAIIVIGVVGLALDRLFGLLHDRVAFSE
ncbi:MAG: nitrate ABC transporter permease [Candidatus Velthaea sp.]